MNDAQSLPLKLGPFVDPQDPDALRRLQAALPPGLSEVFAYGREVLGVSPLPALAAALAQAAAAMGASCRLQITSAKSCTAAFNLLMVSQAGANAEWMRWLGQGWLSPAQKLAHARQQIGKNQIETRLRRQMQFFQEWGNLQGPHRVQVAAELRQIQVVAQPSTIGSSLKSRDILRSLGESFDGQHCLMNGGLDPLHDWLLLHRAQQIALLRFLKESWLAQPLSCAKEGTPVAAALHFIWCTQLRQVKQWHQLIRQRHKDEVLPVLMVSLNEQPLGIPNTARHDLKQWHVQLAKLFERRLAATVSSTSQLSKAALQYLLEFRAHFEARCQTCVPALKSQLLWLSDMPLRLSLILAALSEETPTGVVDIPTMEVACEITLWLAQEHLSALERIMGPFVGLEGSCAAPKGGGHTSADYHDKSERRDMEELAQAIFGRLAHKGPLTGRQLTRTFNKLYSCQRDAALEKLKQSNRIAFLPEGKWQVQNQN